MRKTANKQKIAQARSYSRKYTVRNCTIKVSPNPGIGEWEDDLFHTLPKSLSKKDKVYSHTFVYKPLTKNSKEYIETYIRHKVKKWEKKNPCPVKLDGIQQDMFEKEFLLPWQELRKQAVKRITGFVTSIYDKYSLVGRYKQSEDKYEHKEITKIRDKTGDVSKYKGVNHLPENSNLLKTAKTLTDKDKEIHENLVCTTLKDEKNKQGRIILPGLKKIA